MTENVPKSTASADSGSPSSMGFDSAAAVATIETMVTAQNNSPKGSWLDTMTAKVAGVIFAVAATAVTFSDAVSRAFFKTVNKGGAFIDLQKKRDDALEIINAPARGEEITLRGEERIITKITPREVPNAKSETRKILKIYDQELKARKKLLGYNNVFDEMSALKKHQWYEVAFATAAVASVAVGAIMAIASSRSTVKKHAEALEKQSSQQR